MRPRVPMQKVFWGYRILYFYSRKQKAPQNFNLIQPFELVELIFISPEIRDGIPISLSFE